MASSLAEDLVCPICLALFQEPLMLGCGHNFCRACLDRAIPIWWLLKGTCPECRTPFHSGEVKRNRALGNLAEKARRYKLDEEEPLLPPGSSAGLWPSCEAHDEPLKLFCTQDEAPICVICRDLPQHRGHDFLPTKDAVQRAQGKLKAYLKPLEKFVKKNAEDEINQQKEIEALKNCTEDLLGHISKEFEALHQILHKKEQDIKLVVEKMKAENMEKMEDSLTSLKEEASSRIETIAEVKAALEATDHVFLKGFKELVKKIKEHHQGSIDEDEDWDDEDWEDEDSEDENSNEEETSDADSCNTEVITVAVALKKFKDFLDFEACKKKFECIIPGNYVNRMLLAKYTEDLKLKQKSAKVALQLNVKKTASLLGFDY
ncbi:PREDICTED: nuclear factor 7, brain-like [Gekko japonicus]|uniref:Nuclear factor 7, brain-like n=1 Tax=Gekko japonicus TaxID=146911 RepID=A0ABM1KGI6_GEKJA|nr:PREDICTED: nuclear factor 7, brain-like [Gekko japonicus]